MFNRSGPSNKTLKDVRVYKNDTRSFSPWDVPLALVLLTRLPVPKLPDAVFARQAQAVWAYPLAGLVVGGLACLIGWAAMAANLPSLACAGLIVAVLVCATGAMHEDGLADTFDGLWGGFDVTRRLAIMKDSHIGTYGVLALLISQLVRIAAVAALVAAGALWSVVAACVVSRALMPVVMTALPNARPSGLSHSVGVPRIIPVAAGVGLAVGLAILMSGAQVFLATLIAAGAVSVLAYTAKAKIGGQTGDILGASQQLGEIAFLLALTTQV